MGNTDKQLHACRNVWNVIATKRVENKNLREAGWRSRPGLDIDPNPKALMAGCEDDHSPRNASLETSDICKALGWWPAGCVWHPWLDPLPSPDCPWPWAESLFRCWGPRCRCFLSWVFLRRGQPATDRSCVIWRGWTQLDERTGFKPWSRRHIHILLIQTFVSDSNYTSYKLILSGWYGKDETLKTGVKVNIDLSCSLSQELAALWLQPLTEMSFKSLAEIINGKGDIETCYSGCWKTR